MIIHKVDQGTPEWLRLRLGIPTASLFEKIITPGGKKSTSAAAYMNHLLAERMLSAPIDGFQSKWMERGSALEKNAVASYELANECDTERVGFVTIDEGRIGCSPDRFIVDCDNGMLEAKAPSPAVHVSYLLMAAGASLEYKVQLQGQLWCCEREWVDIISFHPGLPNATFRVNRDEVFITELAAHVRSFSRQLEERTEDFKSRGWIKDKAAEQDPELDASFLNDADMQWALSRDYPEVQ